MGQFNAFFPPSGKTTPKGWSSDPVLNREVVLLEKRGVESIKFLTFSRKFLSQQTFWTGVMHIDKTKSFRL